LKRTTAVAAIIAEKLAQEIAKVTANHVSIADMAADEAAWYFTFGGATA
jgi:hypothetical protein